MATGIKLTGKQKAAILLISMGKEASSKVFNHMSEEEIEQLTLAIANVKKVDSKEKEEVLKEFHEMCIANDYLAMGGITFAQDVLETALGRERAKQIIQKLTVQLEVKPFDFARRVDPMQLYHFLQNEHPQTIALVLAHLEPQQASTILSSLPEELQADVARRIAQFEQTSPDVIKEVEQILEQKLSATIRKDFSVVGGIESIVGILNGVDRGTEKSILENLGRKHNDLVEEIKKRMFVFEDIINLDRRAIQRVIQEVDNQDLMLALKASSPEVKKVIYENMSQRMVESFEEEMQYLGPVRVKDVEEAQGRIVSVIRHLEDAGEIIIARGANDGIIL
ncbi:flagellar motor switch protein FliG [Neobacillus sp. OS1-32]|uniref:Flagellar motor switch protein FliG n=1 Tax=Neobacillus paridis TaxID=2803862 RepID=A0ABS1TSR9_9BACI|nr:MULTISPECIES: flagellar motor switch protein FliG [Neobacillus]MBL4952950.1 flagellar motor switch protein FliG [Neobacillus paridis]WML31528.1 flagellar motor switch protein FliG [Neobacillus sp. OS1-32]